MYKTLYSRGPIFRSCYIFRSMTNIRRGLLKCPNPNWSGINKSLKYASHSFLLHCSITWKDFPYNTSIQITYRYQFTMYNSDSNCYNWKRWRSRTSFSNSHMFPRPRESVCIRMSFFPSLETTNSLYLQYSLK